VPALKDLYQRYRDRVEFYVVYIQEAHPIDAWQMPVNERENVLVHSTQTLDERSHVAGTCVIRLGIHLPAVIDGPDDAVERAYTGWPDRLYVIDRDGRVAFKSAAGPFGFHPEDVEHALDKILPSGNT
jgi:Iodothyronine deiodinase